MITIKKINSETVKPIQVNVFDKSKIEGYDLFPNPFCNIFICAKKHSGKTSVIFKILDSSHGKDTIIHLFCSTARKDQTWQHITKYFEKKKIEVNVYQSIKEGKVDMLKKILEDLAAGDNEEELDDDLQPSLLILIDDTPKKCYQRKSNKIYPKHIFIFDDIGDELTSTSVTQLLKTNRHYCSRGILSSQNVNDVTPSGRRQIDNWLFFKGHQKDKLETIYNNADLSIEFVEFLGLYNTATEDKYNFLYIDTGLGSFRKNFNEEMKLD